MAGTAERAGKRYATNNEQEPNVNHGARTVGVSPPPIADVANEALNRKESPFPSPETFFTAAASLSGEGAIDKVCLHQVLSFFQSQDLITPQVIRQAWNCLTWMIGKKNGIPLTEPTRFSAEVQAEAIRRHQEALATCLNHLGQNLCLSTEEEWDAFQATADLCLMLGSITSKPMDNDRVFTAQSIGVDETGFGKILWTTATNGEVRGLDCNLNPETHRRFWNQCHQAVKVEPAGSILQLNQHSLCPN